MSSSNEIIIESDIPSPLRVKGNLGIFGAILGLFLWIFLALFFLFVMYVGWFGRSVNFCLQLIKKGNYQVPFWFSAICVIFFFPITLILVIVSSALKIWQENAKI